MCNLTIVDRHLRVGISVGPLESMRPCSTITCVSAWVVVFGFVFHLVRISKEIVTDLSSTLVGLGKKFRPILWVARLVIFSMVLMSVGSFQNLWAVWLKEANGYCLSLLVSDPSPFASHSLFMVNWASGMVFLLLVDKRFGGVLFSI